VSERDHFAECVGDFLAWFETLFDHDWEHTKACLQSPDCIAPDGTFLNPRTEESAANWANREGFLDAYRRLRMLLLHQSIDPDQREQLEALFPPGSETENN
jgi:hypothetical protein